MLRLSGAGKIYYGDKNNNRVRALEDIHLWVRPGEYVSVSGASGSGKSTLMHILGLLDTLTEGSYFLDGENVSGLPGPVLSRLRSEKIGFVFQRFQLIPGMTALENIALPLLLQGVPRPERLRRAGEALTAVGLSHRAAHRPEQLSGGQQQRVAVARAVITRPRVLLADEPTAGLDPAAASDILDLLDALHRQGHTIVLITHDPAAASRAARQLRLENGRLQEKRGISYETTG